MSKRPIMRVVYRDKETKERFDVATIWPPQNEMDGLVGGFKAETEAKDGQYKKMPLVEALALREEGKGYLDVWRVKDGQGATKRHDTAQDRAGSFGADVPPDDFGDDQIPF